MTYTEALFEAACNKELVENYDRLTNSNFGKVIAANGINKMIDEATGFAEGETKKFCKFFDEFIWQRLPEGAVVDMHEVEIEGWNNARENPPKEAGWYKIKLSHGEYEAPFVSNLGGDLLWLIPDQSDITHWKEK